MNQIKVLQKIFNNLIGKSRLTNVGYRQTKYQLLNRNNFNASTAAINGFSILQMKLFIC